MRTRTTLKDVVLEMNRMNVTMDRMVDKLVTLIDIQEKRNERQYFEIRRLTERNENNTTRTNKSTKAKKGRISKYLV